ncbi:hypothetical protein [Actinokineospora sp.]|uniref:hypothetical protein n=1 Tax=Actinokineospora sp. TaxID=1872133 RepID=UPI0040383BFD
MRVLVPPMIWARGEFRRSLVHMVDTRDGTPHTTTTDHGLRRVAVCGQLLADVDSNESDKATREVCGACADVAARLGGIV